MLEAQFREGEPAAVDSPATTLVDALLEAQTEATGAGFLAVTSHGIVLSCNSRFATWWGVPGSVLATGSLATIVHWLAREGGESGLSLAAVLTMPQVSDDGELTLLDGRSIAWRTSTIRGERAGAIARGRVWAFQDVTIVRNAASALRDAEHWLRMFEAHTDGIVLELDAEARFVSIWAAQSDFFDQPDNNLRGRHLSSALGEVEGALFEARIRRILATGQPENFEYVLDSRDERRVFAVNAVLLPGEGKRPPRVTVLMRDVTSRARLQAQLLQAERLASVGLLAAGVAHEINNPLAYVLLNLERIRLGLRDLAKDRPSDAIANLLESANMSLEGSRRVEEIVYNLRRFSRSDSDEMRVPVDIHRVLSFAIDMASPALRRHATIVREFGQVPCVMASEGSMSQVFLNLIINAAQAIPEGEPGRNEVRLLTETDSRGYAVIEVRDTGVGIPPSVIPSIFDPFFTTKSPGVGTGLGLAICHGIVTSLGGGITVESHEGRGSTFRVVLPPADHEFGVGAEATPPVSLD